MRGRFMRFTVRGEAYGPEEMALLTRKALKMDDSEWVECTEAEQQEFFELELWNKASMQAYEEDQAELARSDKSSKSAKQKREERATKSDSSASRPVWRTVWQTLACELF